MRHTAWLNTAPEKAENDISKAPAKTRLQQMRAIAGDDEEFEPEMPLPGAAAYLLDHLWAAGPTLGDAPLSSGELRDYQANMGVILSPWECSTLRRLSIDYLNESHCSTKADRPAPFAEASDAVRLEQMDQARKAKMFFD